MFSHKFTEALEYAAAVHHLQRRKGTAIPYMGHLLGVASIVIDAGGTEEEAIAALLHDAPEDQGGTERLLDIRQRFGERVAAIIEGCSDPLTSGGKSTSMTYEERKLAYLSHLRSCANASVFLVSAADKLHNARATLMDFRAHGHGVWDRFSAGHSLILDHGPQDPRREGSVRELEATIGALREESMVGI